MANAYVAGFVQYFPTGKYLAQDFLEINNSGKCEDITPEEVLYW